MQPSILNKKWVTKLVDKDYQCYRPSTTTTGLIIETYTLRSSKQVINYSFVEIIPLADVKYRAGQFPNLQYLVM